jgi:copper chaperone CopZ
MITRRSMLLAVGATLAVGQMAEAEEVQQTAILIGNMHCTECAKKIARGLYAVPGVVGVIADVKTNLAHVTPQKTKQPSPRALWEAIELAKFQPVKLVGPYGTFTSKPNV